MSINETDYRINSASVAEGLADAGEEQDTIERDRDNALEELESEYDIDIDSLNDDESQETEDLAYRFERDRDERRRQYERDQENTSDEYDVSAAEERAYALDRFNDAGIEAFGLEAWTEGVELISESELPEYARELATELGKIDQTDGAPDWPFSAIDYGRAAELLRQDWKRIAFGNTNFYALPR